MVKVGLDLNRNCLQMFHKDVKFYLFNKILLFKII